MMTYIKAKEVILLTKRMCRIMMMYTYIFVGFLGFCFLDPISDFHIFFSSETMEMSDQDFVVKSLEQIEDLFMSPELLFEDNDWDVFGELESSGSQLSCNHVREEDEDQEECNTKKRTLNEMSPLKKVPKLRQSNKDVTSMGTSKYRGVIWDNSVKSWRSKLKVGTKSWYLGVFREEDEAGKSYDVAAFFLHGQRANLNFPSQNYENIVPKKIPAWLIPHIKDSVIKYPNHASLMARAFLQDFH